MHPLPPPILQIDVGPLRLVLAFTASAAPGQASMALTQHSRGATSRTVEPQHLPVTIPALIRLSIRHLFALLQHLAVIAGQPPTRWEDLSPRPHDPSPN